jgi:hypothetical protein
MLWLLLLLLLLLLLSTQPHSPGHQQACCYIRQQAQLQRRRQAPHQARLLLAHDLVQQIIGLQRGSTYEEVYAVHGCSAAALHHLLQLWQSCKRCKAVLSCSQPGSLTQLQQQKQQVTQQGKGREMRLKGGIKRDKPRLTTAATAWLDACSSPHLQTTTANCNIFTAILACWLLLHIPASWHAVHCKIVPVLHALKRRPATAAAPLALTCSRAKLSSTASLLLTSCSVIATGKGGS